MKTIGFSLLLALMVTLYTPVVTASEGLSKQQAVSIVQQKYPGRVLSVKHKGDIYRVKTLSANGEIRIILVDANSGKIVSGK